MVHGDAQDRVGRQPGCRAGHYAAGGDALLYRQSGARRGQAARKGTLSPGKLADLIVLDRDPCAVDPDEIRHTQVLATLVGGQATYRAAGTPSWADELPMRE